jgi:hypothetical protein
VGRVSAARWSVVHALRQAIALGCRVVSDAPEMRKAWPYQDEFFRSAESLIRRLFARLGVPTPAIGLVAIPSWVEEPVLSTVQTSESLRWRPSAREWAKDILAAEADVKSNSNLEMLFLGSSSRAIAFRRVVDADLGAHETHSGTWCPSSVAARIWEYDVILVLELERQLCEPFPRVDILAGERADGSVGLLDAAAEAVLRKLSSEVSKERAGLATDANPRDVDDVLRDAGNLLLTAVTWTFDPKRRRGNFFEQINTLSSLRYENAEARGRLIIGSEESAGPCELAFKQNVPVREVSWARKFLQMSTDRFVPLCDGESLSGIVRRPEARPEFSVRFRGHGRWDLAHGTTTLASAR